MRLGDDQKVGRRLGRDVIEGIAQVILVDLAAGDFPGDDLAKQAIAHFGIHLPSSRLIRPGERSLAEKQGSVGAHDADGLQLARLRLSAHAHIGFGIAFAQAVPGRLLKEHLRVLSD